MIGIKSFGEGDFFVGEVVQNPPAIHEDDSCDEMRSRLSLGGEMMLRARVESTDDVERSRFK